MTAILEHSTLEPLKGTVKWFSSDKGFGVIIHKTEETNTEYFVHHTDIKTGTSIRSYLEESEQVMFTPSNEASGKLKAIGVHSAEEKLRCLKNNTGHTTTQSRRNTTSFKPQEKCCDLRILTGWSAYDKVFNRSLSTRDIVLLDPFMPNSIIQATRNENPEFGLPDMVGPDTWFNFFKEELDTAKENNPELMKLWHGDSHLIADDKIEGGNWKELCPRFSNLINSISKMFNMKVTSTRINEYRNGNDWKPYHHDAAAIKEHMKKIQNITVSISFGGTRSVAFQHSKTYNTFSIPLMDGYIYSFGQKVNTEYKHGILKDDLEIPPRLSIILWGWVEQKEPSSYQ